MGDVVNLADRQQAILSEGDLSHEQFLMGEGLELLAAYRSLDADVRKSLLQLVKSIASSQVTKSALEPPPDDVP